VIYRSSHRKFTNNTQNNFFSEKNDLKKYTNYHSNLE